MTEHDEFQYWNNPIGNTMINIENSVAAILKHKRIRSKLLDAAEFVGLSAEQAHRGFQDKIHFELLVRKAEKAYYYYKDILYRADPTLPISLLTGNHAVHLFGVVFYSVLCPTLSLDEIVPHLSKYAVARSSADSCGVVIVKSSFKEVLLVQEWNHSWGFPKGTREHEVSTHS